MFFSKDVRYRGSEDIFCSPHFVTKVLTSRMNFPARRYGNKLYFFLHLLVKNAMKASDCCRWRSVSCRERREESDGLHCVREAAVAQQCGVESILSGNIRPPVFQLPPSSSNIDSLHIKPISDFECKPLMI